MAPLKPDLASFKKLVKKASKMPNAVVQTGSLPANATTIDGEPLNFVFSWGTNLHSAQFLWIFELFNDNMMEMYKQSDWGYEENSKKAELQAATSRYIIVRNSKNKHIGYVHYRFDIDDGEPVLYCFELQITQAYQKRNIGTLLIDILLDLAKKTGMHKVMATVFTFNGRSLAFFHKNGFRLDDTSPSIDPKTGNAADYVILSRYVSGEKAIVIPPQHKENQLLEDMILNFKGAPLNLSGDGANENLDTSQSVILRASQAAKNKSQGSPKAEPSVEA